MPPPKHAAFEIHISKAAAAKTYPVRVERPGGASAEGTLELDLEDQDFGALLAQVEGVSPDADARKQFGGLLFKKLFAQQAVRDAWVFTYGGLVADPKTLRVRLQIDDPELAGLPWELLYDSATYGFLAVDPSVVFSRYLQGPEPAQPKPQPRLRVLLAVADPRGPLQLPAIEQAAIEDIQQKIKDVGARVESELLRSASVSAIQKQFEGKDWDVVHVIAHGTAGKIALVSEDRTTMALLEDAQFAQIFAGRSVRLVLLGVCQSAKSEEKAIFRGVGPALIEKRVPAVVAMQYRSVLLDTAAAFAGAFYDALAASLPMDVAVNEARQRLAALMDLGGRDWSTPVLLLGTKDVSIVEIATAQGVAPAAPTGAAKTASDIAGGMERIRRRRRIELPLINFDTKVRAMIEETKRTDDDAKRDALGSMVNDCITLNDSLQNAIAALDPADAAKLEQTKNPVKAIADNLGKIDEALAGEPPGDVKKQCNEIQRLIQRALQKWREDINDEFDALDKLVLSLRFA